MEKELTPKQQTSEAIRQADTILVVTGQHPSVDQVAATIALTAIVRKFGKKVTAVVSDEIPAGARFLATNVLDNDLGGLRDFIMQVDLKNAEVDKLKYTIENGQLNVHVTPFSGGFKSTDVTFDYGDYQYDLVIVLGVASYSRIDKVYTRNADALREVPLINIDFHRSNEQYGAINLIEGTAASLGEILVALSESLQNGLIDQQIATTLLAGITAATDRFTATHTTAKALTVAAQMMAAGADHGQVIRGLYRSDRGDRDNSKPQKDRSQTSKRSEEPPRQPSLQQSAAQPKTERPEQSKAQAPVEVKQAQSVVSEPTPEPTTPSEPQPEDAKPAPAMTPSAPVAKPGVATIDPLLPVKETVPMQAVTSDPAQTPPRNPLESLPTDDAAAAPDVDRPVAYQPAATLDTSGPAVTDPDDDQPVYDAS
jgi:nanoRNase/pAp phosphatase (c-di-AMP/oligoRNAs hydrolase)